jgi:predicted transcriptional regulator
MAGNERTELEMRVSLDGLMVMQLRMDKWLSIREASEMAEVSYSTWRNVEKGRTKVRTSTARKIAQVLGVEAMSLARVEEGLHLVREPLSG